MAIIGPSDLPSVLKVNSNPLKFHAISTLGHPNVLVEMQESQWEQVLRSLGDFIAGYFPNEEKYSYFYTSPLVSTYDLPEEAYWVRHVAWDPATTNIDDIFGAESFLFCMDSEFKILDKDKKLQPVIEWEKHWKAHTPYGSRKLKIIKRKLKKPIPKLKVEYKGGVFGATINHPILANDKKWRELQELKVGDVVHGVKNTMDIQNLKHFISNEAFSIRANNAGAYYGCQEGEPILIH